MAKSPPPSFSDIGYPPFDRPGERPEPEKPSNWGITKDYILLSEVVKSEFTTTGKDLIYAVCNRTTKHAEWRAKTLHEGLQALSGLQEALDTERGEGTAKN